MAEYIGIAAPRELGSSSGRGSVWQWHSHSWLCLTGKLAVGAPTFGGCASGDRKRTACETRDSARGSQLVEILNVGARRSVHALHLGVLRLDDVVLVRSVRAASMAQPEMPCREPQRLAGKHVTRPGPGEARQDHGINSVA